MKNFRKNILFSALVIIGLTSCFDEKEEDYTIVGPVGAAAIITTIKDVAGIEKPLTDPPASGDKIFVNVRYYSEYVAVKQVKLFVAVGTGANTELWTKAVTEFDTNNSYEHKIEYTVPAAPSKTRIRFTAEVLTVNELASTKVADVITK